MYLFPNVIIYGRNCRVVTSLFIFPIQHGRLCSGDHILKIGDTDLTGMSSEQVAQVLRQCGNRVKLVIARGPVEEPPPPAVPPGTPVPITTTEKQVSNCKYTCGKPILQT